MRCYFRLLCVFLLILFLFAGGCIKNPVTGRKELVLIPKGQEIALGVNSAPEFEKEFGGKVDNAQLQRYVGAVGGKLAAVSDREMPYEYALLSSNIPNAFAVPGGKIYVTVGLFRQMSNERQLAAVLAHETVHIAAGHSVQGLQREMGAGVFAELVGAIIGGEGAESAAALAKYGAALKNLDYSREDESESDEYGLKYMDRAGYNPWGMVELLELLQSLSNARPGLFGDLFASHPLTSKRVSRVREIIARDYSRYSAQSGDPRAQRFEQMRALLKSVSKE